VAQLAGSFNGAAVVLTRNSSEDQTDDSLKWGVGAETRDERALGRGPLASPPEQSDSAGEDRLPTILRREGEFWTARFEGKIVRLRHCKGLALMDCLLRHPDQEFHASDLDALVNGGIDSQINFETIRSVASERNASDAGPLLDASAKSNYRKRLEELREELREARSFDDSMRVSKLEQEMAFLSSELSRAIGLGGADRMAASLTERARIRVTNAIKSAIRRLSEHHQKLGRYLANSIRTGNFCSYVTGSPSARPYEKTSPAAPGNTSA
jgi:hypothetical protein